MTLAHHPKTLGDTGRWVQCTTGNDSWAKITCIQCGVEVIADLSMPPSAASCLCDTVTGQYKPVPDVELQPVEDNTLIQALVSAYAGTRPERSRDMPPDVYVEQQSLLDEKWEALTPEQKYFAPRPAEE